MMPNSKDEIINALAHLVALLVAERNAPPEDGGWIRTENTAYRPKKAPEGPTPTQDEKRAQIGSIGAKNRHDGRGLNHPGTNSCSICGLLGVNRRTCISENGDQRHREPIGWHKRGIPVAPFVPTRRNGGL